LAHYFIRGHGFAIKLGMLSFISEQSVYEDLSRRPNLALRRCIT